MTKESWKLIALKRNAEGADGFARLQKECKFIARTKLKTESLPQNRKQWWKLSSTLLIKA